MNIEKKIREIRKKNLFPVVIAVMFIMLIVPTFVRYYSGNDALIGQEPYYHMRAASILIKTGSLNMFNPPEGVQELVSNAREYHFNPYHYLLAYASKFMTLNAASSAVPLLLGLLTILMLNLLLGSLIEDRFKKDVILLILVMSPAFIYTFTVSNPNAAAIFFTTAGLLFFIREKKYNILPSAICFAVVSLFSIYNTIIAGLFMIAYIASQKKSYARFMVMIFVVGLVSFSKDINLFYSYTYVPSINILGNLLSDLGSMIGFGTFTIILATYGIYANWHKKSSYKWFLITGIGLIISLFYVGNMANMYLVYLVAAAAGYGLLHLLLANWDVRVIKNLTMLIIVCGLIFSTVAYMTRLVETEPDHDVVEALEWMSENTFKDGFTLTDQKNGFLVSAIARNPVLADSYHTTDYDQRFTYKLQESIFYSRNLEETKKLFRIYNIKHIIVDKNMKEGGVWSRENEGLLFLFTNKETFEKIYEKNGIDIWKVKNAAIDDDSARNPVDV